MAWCKKPPTEASSAHDSRAEGLRAQCRRAAFTLMELLVVIIIIVMLASLVLTGLAAAQERTREEQTKSTIAKIHGQVMQLWDAYRTRRIQCPVANDRRLMAQMRLEMIWAYQRQEMPDTYQDMLGLTLSISGVTLPASPLANWVSNAAFAADQNESAECLYLTVTFGMNADAQVKFSAREVGDTDGDGNPEFIDGWGNPIAFLRWAPGVVSEIQHDPAADFHPDPFDPIGVNRPFTPPGSPPFGFRLYPLVVSPGPDGYYGLYPLDVVGAFASTENPYQQYGGMYFRGQAYLTPAVAAENGTAGDNLHNHSLGVK